MDNREQLRRITELTEQIAGLPKGYLSKKPSAERSITITSGRKTASSRAAICTTVRSRRWQIKSKSARNCRRSCAC